MREFSKLRPELSEEYKYALELNVPLEIVNISAEIVKALKGGKTWN